jgi:hypothetical protein
MPAPAAFVLTVGPQDAKFAACLAAVARARAEGREIFLYCIDDGIAAIGDPRLDLPGAPAFHLLGCAYAAERRNLPRRPELATYGGLKMLGDLIAHTGTCHSF